MRSEAEFCAGLIGSTKDRALAAATDPARLRSKRTKSPAGCIRLADSHPKPSSSSLPASS